jgi:hypothetical protein
MNAKKLKLLRRSMLPGREETGISRGAFLRALTQYTEDKVKKFVLQFPLDEEGNEVEDFEWHTSTKVLDPNCPRGLYKNLKRKLT